MNRKSFSSLLILPTFLLFTALACVNSNQETESDSDTSKTYTIANFSSLNINVIGEVIYEQSDSFYLTASGSSTLINSLEVSDRKGQLSIELKNRIKFSGEKKKLTIRIGSPYVEAINFESVGTLHIKNNFKGDRLNINNDGVGQILIDDCHVSTFKLITKSVGTITAKGTSKDVFIESEGVGSIDCSELKSENTKVISKGAGNLSVYATKSLDISLQGIGNVSYYGNPVQVKTDIKGLGKATKKDN